MGGLSYSFSPEPFFSSFFRETSTSSFRDNLLTTCWYSHRFSSVRT